MVIETMKMNNRKTKKIEKQKNRKTKKYII